jgi:hypothetical protein
MKDARDEPLAAQARPLALQLGIEINQRYSDWYMKKDKKTWIGPIDLKELVHRLELVRDGKKDEAMEGPFISSADLWPQNKYSKEEQDAIVESIARRFETALTPRQRLRARREELKKIKKDILALPAEDRQLLVSWIEHGMQEQDPISPARRRRKGKTDQ